MNIFGSHWEDHPQRLKSAWCESVKDSDIVLIPGDISWSMKLYDAAADLEFIDSLPGKKVIIKGNHDFWWSSLSKVKQILPKSIIPLQNTAIIFEHIGVAGARLWIDPDLSLEAANNEDRKIHQRELGRFSLSLKALNDDAHFRIIMTHFPPISLEGKPGKAIQIASPFKCDLWVFGHMHLGSLDYNGFNCIIGSTRFEFVSADFLNFCPKLIYDTDNP
jgi:uncharacterized protein